MEFDTASAFQVAGFVLVAASLYLQSRSTAPSWLWRTLSVVGGFVVLSGFVLKLRGVGGFSLSDPVVLLGLALGAGIPLVLGWMLGRRDES